jgi:hypothetical protein
LIAPREQHTAAVQVCVLHLPLEDAAAVPLQDWLDSGAFDLFPPLDAEDDLDPMIAAQAWLRRLVTDSNEPGVAGLPGRRGYYRLDPERDGEGGGVHLSFSHTEQGIACAVSRHCKVGIDLETFRPIKNLSTILALVAHPDEVHRFRAVPDEERLARLYCLWAAKESLLKAIDSDQDISLACLSFTEGDHGKWQLSDYPTEQVGTVRSSTYVRDPMAPDQAGRPHFVWAVSALAQAVTLTFREILFRDMHRGRGSADTRRGTLSIGKTFDSPVL